MMLGAACRRLTGVAEEADISTVSGGPAGQKSRTSRRPPGFRRLAVAGVTVLVALAVAACGGSSSSTSASASGSSSAGGQAANVAAASAAIAPYTGHPSPFPVTTPLRKPLPAGTRFVFLQCSTPICALIRQLLVPAVKTIGGRLTIINSGGTATSQQAAASSALALKPAAVLLTAITPSEFGTSLKRLEAAGIKVTSVGVMNPKPYGIAFSIGGLATTQLAGKLMADWVIVHKGPHANVVFYSTPELDFSPYMLKSFTQELNKNCPSCKLRTASISVTTFGTTAPQTIANDLQGHSGTNVAVFASLEAAEGLPAALQSAGVSVTTIGFAPTPENLQDIKTGRLTAGVGLDLAVQQWSQVDGTARLLLGQPVSPTEDLAPLQILGQKDITFDVSRGWTGYPDFAQRFAKLWHVTP